MRVRGAGAIMLNWMKFRSLRFRVMVHTFAIIILMSIVARYYAWSVVNRSRVVQIDSFLNSSAIWKIENIKSNELNDDTIFKAMLIGVHVLDHYFFGLITVDLDLIQDLETAIVDEHGQRIETIPEMKGFSALSAYKPIFGYSSDYRSRFIFVPLPSGAKMSISGNINGYYKDVYSRMLMSILIFCLGSIIVWPIWWWLTSRALNNCEIIEKTAALIIKDNRNVRINVENMDSEFVPMATNLNLMLDHVNGLHDAQARFVSDASHELRTPIAGILNNAEVGHDDTIEEMREALGYCRESAKRMSRLVNNLLSLKRGEVFRDEPFQSVPVESLFFEAIEQVKSMATDAGIELKISHSHAGIYVRGDSDQLLQVAQNLLANAIQHSQRGDVVRLESGLESKDGKPRIIARVIDQGPGIDKELGARVFERFYRGASEYEGSGLGLAICKAIIDRHGGTITYRPNSPCGTIFEVTLDTVQAKENRRDSDPAATHSPLAPLPENNGTGV